MIDELPKDIQDDLDTLRGDNHRLRGLIAETQMRSGLMHKRGIGWCPWCHYAGGIMESHDTDCPAFDANGNVK